MRARALFGGFGIAAVLGGVWVLPSLAADQTGAAQEQTSRIVAAQDGMASATARADRLRKSAQPAVAIDRLRLDLQIGSSEFAYRDTARSEQVAVYALAADPTLEQEVLNRLPASRRTGLPEAAEGVRAILRLAGITDFSRARVRRTRRFGDAEPVDALLGYYRGAARRTGIDWTYLAAINYIETGFGRTNGPSSAGAMGPMQFLPDTWQQYGGGGDIMSPHDSIEAAATFLRRNGAPGDYDRALLHYNRDLDYVAAVRNLAAAVRSDSSWLNRLYCWNTFG
jgi:soluble lytic murein transglycosylase-like protein